MNLEKLNAQEFFKYKEQLKTILELIKLDIQPMGGSNIDKTRILSIKLFQRFLPNNNWVSLPELAFDLGIKFSLKECMHLLKFVTWMHINENVNNSEVGRILNYDVMKSGECQVNLFNFLTSICRESDYSELCNFFKGNNFAELVLSDSGDRQYIINSAGERFLKLANLYLKSNPNTNFYDNRTTINISSREFIQ